MAGKSKTANAVLPASAKPGPDSQPCDSARRRSSSVQPHSPKPTTSAMAHAPEVSAPVTPADVEHQGHVAAPDQRLQDLALDEGSGRRGHRDRHQGFVVATAGSARNSRTCCCSHFGSSHIRK